MRFAALTLFLCTLLVPGGVAAGDFPMADRVIVEKAARKLHLIKDGEAFRTFRIALGIRPVGDKQQEGDFRTPEGTYLLDARNPNSEYFLSIHISYPNNKDFSQARERGLDPGGAIMIHGQPNIPTRSEAYYRTQDWTNGCIAVSNSDMIDIWLMTPNDTPIEIRP
jgi:murein L,D-transpeptidase YafK